MKLFELVLRYIIKISDMSKATKQKHLKLRMIKELNMEFEKMGSPLRIKQDNNENKPQ